jgi:hypothetical protein
MFKTNKKESFSKKTGTQMREREGRREKERIWSGNLHERQSNGP